MSHIIFLPLVEDKIIARIRTGIFVNLLKSLEVKGITWVGSVGKFLNPKFGFYLHSIFPLFSRDVFSSFILCHYQYYLL